MCPPCHQESDRRAKKPSPYYVCPWLDVSRHDFFELRSNQGFYHDTKPGTLASRPAALCPNPYMISELWSLSMSPQPKFVAVHS